MFIKYGVTVPQAKPGQQVSKARIYYHLQDLFANPVIRTVDAAMTDGAEGSAEVSVPQGSSGKAWYTLFDKAGNESLTKSPEFTWTNASDETPPDGPEGALVFSKGDAIEDPVPNPFDPPVPPPVEPPVAPPVDEPAVG